MRYPSTVDTVFVLPSAFFKRILGKSIFNQSSKTNVGKLLLKYGGGGHIAAGTCQIDDSSAGAVQIEIARRVLADG